MHPYWLAIVAGVPAQDVWALHRTDGLREVLAVGHTQWRSAPTLLLPEQAAAQAEAGALNATTLAGQPPTMGQNLAAGPFNASNATQEIEAIFGPLAPWRSMHRRVKGLQDLAPWASRMKHWKHQPREDASVGKFFGSAVAFMWAIFFVALAGFIALHLCLIDWPSTKRYHWLALLVWFVAAVLYNLVIWARLGDRLGRKWLTGYFLEFVFSIENVFIYHIVVEAFKMPKRHAQKALFVVVCCQVVFQMVFFMGLAGWLQSIMVLPYILGLWLLYVGVATVREGDHASFDISESLIFRACRWCLAGRLSPAYRMDGSVFFVENGRTRATMLLPAIACLLLVDFVMEIDVTLTKIEEIQNHYIGFTSSVAAAFAVPELFFVASDLFKRFHLLKYGVSFVLLFFGTELMLHRFVHIPDLVGIAIIVVVLILCVAFSKATGYYPRSGETEEERGEAQDRKQAEADASNADQAAAGEAPAKVEDKRLPREAAIMQTPTQGLGLAKAFGA